jgi:hypothetical protein
MTMLEFASCKNRRRYKIRFPLIEYQTFSTISSAINELELGVAVLIAAGILAKGIRSTAVGTT